MCMKGVLFVFVSAGVYISSLKGASLVHLYTPLHLYRLVPGQLDTIEGPRESFLSQLQHSFDLLHISMLKSVIKDHGYSLSGLLMAQPIREL